MMLDLDDEVELNDSILLISALCLRHLRNILHHVLLVEEA